MKNWFRVLFIFFLNIFSTISYADDLFENDSGLPDSLVKHVEIQPILNDIHNVSECVEQIMMKKWDMITQSNKEEFYQEGLDNCSILNSYPKDYYILFKSIHYDDKRPVGIRAFVITPFLLSNSEKSLLEQHILNYNEIYQPAYMEENVLNSTVRSLSIHNGQEKTILVYKQTLTDTHNDNKWSHFKKLNEEQLVLDITIDYPL